MRFEVVEVRVLGILLLLESLVDQEIEAPRLRVTVHNCPKLLLMQ
jgi:hypothetical protein